jgi:tRNA pseudouridine55 synthase
MNDSYWINLYKPKGISSAKAVAIIKKFGKFAKVGHGGTLDPAAEGVLPIAVNKATKTASSIESTCKKYFFTITWGEDRDTDDSEGKVIATSNLRPTAWQIVNSLASFCGKISQTPSKFSAIKVDGKRAYKLARTNTDFEMKSREITIYQIKLCQSLENSASFEVLCSKGTFVRTIARQLSDKMQVCGFVSKLVRLQVGNFDVANTISLRQFTLVSKNLSPTANPTIQNSAISRAKITIPAIFKQYIKIDLTLEQSKKLNNGICLSIDTDFLAKFAVIDNLRHQQQDPLNYRNISLHNSLPILVFYNNNNITIAEIIENENIACKINKNYKNLLEFERMNSQINSWSLVRKITSTKLASGFLLRSSVVLQTF